ncbi:MFS transporter [Gemella morbillorum]|uniref:MFS transporter n=1 Tax=Gemella morbillorum TaxID=29391 RepID=UPI0028D0D09C|nr:MFS transporter [Gemella morbillorum]
MSSKNWLSTNYFLQFAVNGVFLPFWILYLTGVKNLTVLEASTIFSMLYLARFLGGIFLNPYLLKRYNISLSLKISVIAGILLALSYGITNNKIILTLITFMFGLVYYTVAPFIESLASLFLKEEGIDYGKARTWGSVSFTLVGIAAGGIIGYIGSVALYYILIILLVLYVVFMFLPQPKLVHTLSVNKGDNKNTGRLYSWVLKDKNALLLILVIFLYQLSHTAYNNYNALYLESMNINAKWLSGLILNISVIAEILFFIFSKKIIGKIKPTQLLVFCGIGAIIRWLMLAIFHNIYVFVVMQTFHAITFAVGHIAFILILNNRFNTEKIIDMQILYTAICYQLSMTIGLYIMGAIWDINSSLVFYVSAGIALVGTIFATRIREK